MSAVFLLPYGLAGGRDSFLLYLGGTQGRCPVRREQPSLFCYIIAVQGLGVFVQTLLNFSAQTMSANLSSLGSLFAKKKKEKEKKKERRRRKRKPYKYIFTFL